MKPGNAFCKGIGVKFLGATYPKTIPHAFGERAVLKRMFAALARASQTWRRLVISEFELKQIEELKTERHTEVRQRTTPAALPTASRLHFSSNNKRFFEGFCGIGLCGRRSARQAGAASFKINGSWSALRLAGSTRTLEEPNKT